MADSATKDSGNEDDYDKVAFWNLVIKVFVCCMVWLALFALIYSPMEALYEYAGFTTTPVSSQVMFGLSFIIWAAIMLKILPQFTLQLPALTGIVTINTITGTMYWYRKPGLILIYPWERQAFEIIIGKEVVVTSVKDPLDDTFEPEIFSTKDGSITAEYGFVIKPNVKTIKDALDFQKVDRDGQAAVFKQITSQFFSDKFIDMSTEQALIGKAALSRELTAFLSEDADQGSPDPAKRQKSKGQELREEFKVSIRNPELYEVDLPPNIKGARDQKIIEQERHDSARRLYGKNPGDPLTPDELKLALASQETIKYSVTELNVKGLENLTQLSLPPGGLASLADPNKETKRGK